MLSPETEQQTTAIRAAMRESTEDTCNAEGARVRIAAIFAAFYDDEPGEPGQAIRDLLTDIMHEAKARGVDMSDALDRAAWMCTTERELT